MSWDKVNFIEVAPCACGNGRVKRLGYTEYDDWNRSRDDIVSEVIECENCCKQYRIKHIIKHYLCLSSDGDGVVDKAYLVPNSLEIPKQLEEKTFNFSVPEQIVAMYCLSDILAVRADMLKNKYCTRLKLKK